MDVKIIKPYLILAALLALTVIAVRFGGTPTASMDPGINTRLPDRIGPWKGLNVLYCNAPACVKVFVREDIDEGSPCPLCTEPLSSCSIAERKLLPEDTFISRKQYVNPDGEHVTVTIVVTGAQRSSIHRPEWCLPAQGHNIVSTTLHKITLDDRPPLTVRLLELRKNSSSDSTNKAVFKSAYAYWFVSRGRETTYHLKRMLWMASDSLFRNTTPRWAFISTAAELGSGSNTSVESMDRLISDLYPLMTHQQPRNQGSTLTR